MRVDDVAGLLEKRNLFQHLVTVIAVLTHGGDFFRIEGAGFEQDGIRNRHFPDIVQKSAARNHPNLIVRQTHFPSD